MANNDHVKRVDCEPFPVGEIWDTDISPAQHRRLSWQDKQRRGMTALRRKVALLQDLGTSLASIISEPFIPKDRKRLREWHDPSRGLWSWEDVKLDNPDNLKNKNVIEAFQQALVDIENCKKGKGSVLRRQVSEQNDLIERLELRNAELLEEIGRLRAKLARHGG